MPLPDREQRVLDRIERSLAADDPHFAARMSAVPHHAGHPAPRRHSGLLGLAIGMALVAVGAALGWPLLVVAGAITLAIGCVSVL